MYALLKMAENTKALTVGKVFVLTFEDKNLQSLVISLNKDQLNIGIGSNDEFMPDYSEVSVTRYGKPSGRWRLFDTGATYDSFKVLGISETSIIEVGNLELHGVDLQEKVNDRALGDVEILGLSGASLEILQKEAIPILREVLLNEMLSN